LLSPDEEFSPIGAKSGISYQKSFKAYKDMILAQAPTQRFKRIRSSFDQLLFGTKPTAPDPEQPRIDQGDYDDEIQLYLGRDPTPPPVEPTVAADSDVEPYVQPPPFASAESDIDETPIPSPSPGHHPVTSITLQESDTVRTSSMTISITTLPSEQTQEVTDPAPRKKARPAPKKKVISPPSDAVDTIAPAPTTRSTRAGSRQVPVQPHEQDPKPTTRTSGRKRIN
jgi:hypothetical protein